MSAREGRQSLQHISERLADELGLLRSQLKGNLKADQSIGLIEKYSRQLTGLGSSESVTSDLETNIRKKLEREFQELEANAN
jgi:hypothetical protein